MVPYAVAGRSTTQVQVEYQGIRSALMSVPVVASVPGVFSRDASGGGQGAILNPDGATLNSPANPAAKGSVVALFVTGEGLATAPLIDYYKKTGLVRPIKGVGSIDDIFNKIVGIVTAGAGCSCGCKH